MDKQPINNKTSLSSSAVNLFKSFINQQVPSITENDISDVKSIERSGFIWTDIANPIPGSLIELGKKHDLQISHISKTLQVSHIARIEREPNYIFMILHLPYVDIATNQIIFQQLMVYLGNSYLITVHSSKDTVIRYTFDEVDRQANRLNLETSAEVYSYLIDKVLDSISEIVSSIMHELDEIEDKVFENYSSDTVQISAMRRKIIRLRRMLFNQNSILRELEANIDKLSGQKIARRYMASTNRSVKLLETVDEAAETIEIYKDADFISSQERTNQILAILTVIFTLVIPATTISTIYGMNIKLPGGIETGSWIFLGDYTTLIIMVVISFISGLLMWVYFKRKHWF